MLQVEQSYRTGVLRVAEVPAPRAGARRNLVATRVSLISAGTERQIIDLAKSSLAGKARARPDLVRKTIAKARQEGLVSTARKVFAKLDSPIPLGYSLAGTILESAPDAGGYPVGARVACAGAAVANHAEFNAVPKHLTVPIPAGVSDEDAAFVTVGAIALQGIRVARPELGEVAVVMGLGLIGLLSVQILKANGCIVIGFDPDPSRAALARQMGADDAVSDNLANVVAGRTHGAGADLVIVAASAKSSQPVNTAAEISRMKGRVVVVGMVGMELDREPFYKRELDLRLSMSYGPGRYDPAYENDGHDYPLPYVRWTEQRNMEAFLALVASGRVTPSLLVTHRFRIDQAEEAYALLSSDEPHLGILLEFADEPPAPVRAVSVAKEPVQRTGDGVAFVGMGNYAQSTLFPAVRKAGYHTFSAVVTSSGLSARNAAEKFGFAVAATDPAVAFDDAATGTVFIATRHDSHADYAQRALEAGKHTFVEKPLALDHTGIERVINAATSSAGILAVGFNRRFAPMIETLGGLARSSGGPLLMHYRINAGEVPHDSWTVGSEGGGRIAGEACHFVDALSAICGADPVAVTAMPSEGVGDTLQAIIRFADGSTGHILYSALGDPAAPKERIEVLGRGLVASIVDFRRLTVTRGGKTTETKSSAQDKGQLAMVAAFRSACAAGVPPVPYETVAAVSRCTLDMAGYARA